MALGQTQDKQTHFARVLWRTIIFGEHASSLHPGFLMRKYRSQRGLTVDHSTERDRRDMKRFDSQFRWYFYNNTGKSTYTEYLHRVLWRRRGSRTNRHSSLSSVHTFIPNSDMESQSAPEWLSSVVMAAPRSLSFQSCTAVFAPGNLPPVTTDVL